VPCALLSFCILFFYFHAYNFNNHQYFIIHTMGIQSKLFEITKSYATRAAQEQAFLTHVPPLHGPSCYLEDVLTTVLWNPGENEGMYTGQAYFQMFLRNFEKAFANHATDVAASIDDPSNVPREKERIQLVRKIASDKSRAKRVKAVQLIPKHFDFNDDGMYDPNQPGAVGVQFSLEAFRESDRGIRQKMWNYFLTKLRQQSFPDNRRFWFEREMTGPWVINGTESCYQDCSLAHNHGEADPSLAFWLHKLAFKSEGEHLIAVMKSKDGDVLPTALYEIEREEKMNKSRSIFRKPIYWCRGPDKVIELRTYWEIVKTMLKMSATEYMILCILCGDDYFEHSLVFYKLGPEKILAAMQEMISAGGKGSSPFKAFEDCAGEPRLKGPIVFGSGSQIEVFETLIRLIYTRHYTNSAANTGMISSYAYGGREKDVGLSKFHSALTYRRLEELASAARIKGIADKKKRLETKQKKQAEKGEAIDVGAVFVEPDIVSLPSREKIAKAFQQLRFNLTYWKDRSKWPASMRNDPPAAAAAAAADPEGERLKRELRAVVASGAAAAASCSSSMAESVCIESEEIEVTAEMFEQISPDSDEGEAEYELSKHNDKKRKQARQEPDDEDEEEENSHHKKKRHFAGKKQVRITIESDDDDEKAQ
jgi:hypothetical protein